jgi:hypothetical protein
MCSSLAFNNRIEQSEQKHYPNCEQRKIVNDETPTGDVNVDYPLSGK